MRAVGMLLWSFSLACISSTYETGGRAMSVPGPMAFPCTSDSACGLARCNTGDGPDGQPYNKCAFPCVDPEVDCVHGATCLAGFCVPKPPET